jgi:hypothetical protein
LGGPRLLLLLLLLRLLRLRLRLRLLYAITSAMARLRSATGER